MQRYSDEAVLSVESVSLACRANFLITAVLWYNFIKEHKTYAGGLDISLSKISWKSSISGMVGMSSLESVSFFGITYSLKNI